MTSFPDERVIVDQYYTNDLVAGGNTAPRVRSCGESRPDCGEAARPVVGGELQLVHDNIISTSCRSIRVSTVGITNQNVLPSPSLLSTWSWP
jgi:hypothetical protein